MMQQDSKYLYLVVASRMYCLGEQQTVHPVHTSEDADRETLLFYHTDTDRLVLQESQAYSEWLQSRRAVYIRNLGLVEAMVRVHWQWF
jgi:hypothetical protein